MEVEKKDATVDVLKAVILERKLARRMSYKDLAKMANVSANYLRILMANTNTTNWAPDIRNAVCKVLGIEIQNVMSMVSEDGTEIRFK